MTTDDSMSDDVFEDAEVTEMRKYENKKMDKEYYFQPKNTVHSENEVSTLNINDVPNFCGGDDVVNYRTENNFLQGIGEDDLDDDWKSYRIIEDEDDLLPHKTILLGDSGVGKTSFLVKYNTGEFRVGSFSATVGIALTNKIVTVDHTRVKLQIWDTAGQERFRSVTHAYYRDAHALLLLYDVTNKVSFDNIRAWLVEIREYAQEDVVIMLLGNKADCGLERQIKKEDGDRLAREYNVAFMETSAKTGLNVELAFSAVARQLKCRRSDSIDEAKFNVQDFVREQTHKPTCPPCNM